MSAYLRSRYSQKVLCKWRPYERAKVQRQPHCPVPGWMGDEDRRPFRFDRWAKLPRKAVELYHRVRRMK